MREIPKADATLPAFAMLRTDEKLSACAKPNADVTESSQPRLLENATESEQASATSNSESPDLETEKTEKAESRQANDRGNVVKPKWP